MCSADLKLLTRLLPEMYSIQSYHYSRVVKSTQLPAKFATYLVLAGYSAWHFFNRWHFLNKISLDWPLTLTTQPSISNLSDNRAIACGR